MMVLKKTLTAFNTYLLSLYSDKDLELSDGNSAGHPRLGAKK